MSFLFSWYSFKEPKDIRFLKLKLMGVFLLLDLKKFDMKRESGVLWKRLKKKLRKGNQKENKAFV